MSNNLQRVSISKIDIPISLILVKRVEESIYLADHRRCIFRNVLASQTALEVLFRNRLWMFSVHDIVMQQLDKNEELSGLFHLFALHDLQIEPFSKHPQKDEATVPQHALPFRPLN